MRASSAPFKHIFRVNSSGYELRTLLADRSQQCFSALVDERHVIQVENAVLPRMRSALLFPERPQFLNPRPYQLALQDPSVLCLRFHESDFQHV